LHLAFAKTFCHRTTVKSFQGSHKKAMYSCSLRVDIRLSMIIIIV